MPKSFEREIELSQNGVTQEKLNISLEGLHPSKSVEYSIKFGSKATNKYDVKYRGRVFPWTVSVRRDRS